MSPCVAPFLPSFVRQTLSEAVASRVPEKLKAIVVIAVLCAEMIASSCDRGFSSSRASPDVSPSVFRARVADIGGGGDGPGAARCQRCTRRRGSRATGRRGTCCPASGRARPRLHVVAKRHVFRPSKRGPSGSVRTLLQRRTFWVRGGLQDVQALHVFNVVEVDRVLQHHREPLAVHLHRQDGRREVELADDRLALGKAGSPKR